ncbi:PTS sugar transporter subunit IIC [Terrisporobacter mayombei]|uniref:Transcriptional regulator n=2 Tax=Terrisporobacter TaxID=1505652 RepID=A0A0B3VGT4_9FIRM|nr:PTS sugar transporter subunit IIC [Terrisporobacter othiniensis]MCC3669194.1 PTS sugar transporter subunit IIC [Terrisporobacter mayombei]MCR1822053.1 PTS sugar transporter subunit IIC [Terrisporobacter muris]KHS56001.1 transcriptional regulator [Terrisporobacter othiniensis]MDU6984972.1 PTS sugar transporter subunit IIC [Terrisporobacter othiniensis]MDY3372952.1 PTS sugar transporter subunit IIC [Terrisporobacter othiniensis]
MQILTGTALLLVVLALFTLFSYKAPQGMKAMGALANAACASFLVEAFHFSLFGEQMGIKFLEGVGAANGSLGGVAAGILVPLALGVSPVYAVLVGLTVSGFGILPGFIAGYLVSFVIKFLEKKVPAGLDLIVIIVVAAPLTRGIAMVMDPVVKNTLLQIGQVLIQAQATSPILMGLILGGLITVVATAPLSSMALTSIIGLTGVPMGIGALAVFGSSFMNYVFFSKMKFGSKKDTIAVAIEPLTQSDIISANPIPVYVTNFIGGAMSGIIVALMGIEVGTPGLATPIAGFAVSVAQNGVNGLMAAAGCAVVSIIAGFIGAAIFKNTKIKTADEIRGVQSEESQAVSA